MSALSKTDRICAFSSLGDTIRKECMVDNSKTVKGSLADLISSLHKENHWFSPEYVKKSLLSISDSLNRNNLESWLNTYKIPDYNKSPKNIGVIMAGNIPLVGFHDFLSVLVTGNRINAKMSSKDNQLLKEITRLLTETEPAFKDHILLSETGIDNPDAVIATGSDNSYRYFEYNYSNLPHIFRKNRNSVAITDKGTSDSDLMLLANDVKDYYGLGCRSVSRLFFHKGFDLKRLTKLWNNWNHVGYNIPYSDNYRYQKALLATEGKDFTDTGNILLLENNQLNSPISVLNYSFYNKLSEVKDYLELYSDKIQIVIGSDYLPFGSAQSPALNEYADNIDTVEFLIDL